MEVKNFQLSKKELTRLIKDHPKEGKNSDIGKFAIEIVKLYFLSIDSTVVFSPGSNGSDICVNFKDKKIDYEVKGTEDKNIAYSKLKVSSQKSHDALVKGMELIRVTNLRNKEIKLHFMKYGIDFILKKEPRWAINKIKDK